LTDLRSETKETLDLYGCDPAKPSFARACLLARRMVERGVRFVNIYHEGWDAHSDVAGNLRDNCGKTDRACAALVKDLKRRGMLDETLVIWGGEFGRTPMVESNPALGRSLGRDHHPQAFTIWLAGGGVKAGQTLGATDELGFNVVEKPVHVYDLQATLLSLLGFDHERLTFRHAGRDFRLTDVHGKLVKEIVA
jgi:arylsulfatase A-like enzyme